MRNYFNRIILILMILLGVINTTGCWQEQNIKKRSIVAAVGLDILPDNQVEVTLQIVRPKAAAEVSESDPAEKAVWVYSSTGKTAFEAMTNQLKTVHRKPYYGHNQMIVIGEDLAKSGVRDFIDIFERDPETKLTPLILIAKGTTAKEILNASSQLEPVPVLHLKDILENYEDNPAKQHIDLLDFIQLISKVGHQPVVGTVELTTTSKKENLSIADMKIEGSAAFTGDRLVGWLDPVETFGLQYILDKIRKGIINVPIPNQENKLIAIEQVSSKSKLRPVIHDGELKMVIEIEAKGNLAGQQGSTNFATPEKLDLLSAACERVIEEQVREVIKKAQKEIASDILGFGEVIKKNDLQTWKKVDKDWENVFPTIPVELHVNFNILRTGLITEPLEIN